MKDETALPGRPAITSLADNGSTRGGRGICVVCCIREATTKRRTESYLGFLNRIPEPVCVACAGDLDAELERINRATISVDRAVRKYRGRRAA